MEPPKRSGLYRFFARLVLMFLAWLLSSLQFTKSEVAKMYNVSVKTLNKWVRYFCPNVNFNVWNKKRTFSLDWISNLFESLGTPDKKITLSKGQIIQKCETHYKTLRQNIERVFRKLKINMEAYKNVDIFPPAYTQIILNKMG